MKFYQKLSQHPKVRDAVAFLNRFSSPAPTAAGSDGNAPGPPSKLQTVIKKIVPASPKKQFHAIVSDQILKRNERWRSLAASIDERLPDPLMHPELVAYGSALLQAAKKFEETQGCAPERFLSDNERRACELSSSLGEIMADLQKEVRSFAADMNLTPDATGGERDSDERYHALHLLALYRVATGDQQDRVFELSGYSAEKRLDLVAALLSYMELGFSRAEAVEYLRRRGYVPAALAQQALAKNVLAEGCVSSEESSGKFVQALRAAYVPDDVIREAWLGAGFDPLLIEHALLA
jgi:hypothetical protein